MLTPQRYVLVAIPGPHRRGFTYRVPPDLPMPRAGQRLLLPFARKQIVGFCLGATEPELGYEIKEVSRLVDDQPLLPEHLTKLCLWMADYYFANPYDCFAGVFPNSVRKAVTARFIWMQQNLSTLALPALVQNRLEPGKLLSHDTITLIRKQSKKLWKELLQQGVIAEHWPSGSDGRKPRLVFRLLEPEGVANLPSRGKTAPELFHGAKTRAEIAALGWTDAVIRKGLGAGVIAKETAEELSSVLDFIVARDEVANLPLTARQQVVYGEMLSRLGGGFGVTLLHGITGSGKTLVYCHLAREVIAREKTVLVMTPEISLTGTTLAYFRGFFGDTVTVIHSAMTDRERLTSWQGIRQGKFRIVIGPRSALFAPLDELGLIIVDEEHDSSYKQDEPAPRFHGRDAAIMRAKLAHVPILLGSATPSVESYHQAKSGRYQLLELLERPGSATLPIVRIVDMRTDRLNDLPVLSLPLKREVEKRIVHGEQVILFLNRRGYAPHVQCLVCGHVPQCPNCMVRLTYHKVGNRLVCHYCDHTIVQYDRCQKCQSTAFAGKGAGTQKIEEEIPRLITQAKVVRLDSDAASGRAGAHRILSAFTTGGFNVLLGTQMVTKGLDLPSVSLVGVLSADAGSEVPDFRANEKTFARLVQVAGRSGRAEKKGEVIIQTYDPDSKLIHHAAAQDYAGFFAEELESRRQGNYPPFVRVVNLIFSGPDEDQVREGMNAFSVAVRSRIQAAQLHAEILGPTTCPLYRIQRRYRRHMLVKTREIMKLIRLLDAWEAEQPRFGAVTPNRLTVDVDPDDMM